MSLHIKVHTTAAAGAVKYPGKRMPNATGVRFARGSDPIRSGAVRQVNVAATMTVAAPRLRDPARLRTRRTCASLPL
jgi:hypothetical protein